LLRSALAGQALRPCTALLGKSLLSGKTLLSRRAARTLLAKLLGLTLSTWTSATLAGAALARSTLSALLSLLELRAAGGLLAELFGLALTTGSALAALSTLLSGSALLSGSTLRTTGALLAELLWLALSTLARTALTWAALSTLLSLLELRTTRALLAKLLRLALLPTLLATLLPGLSPRTAWASVGRLGALLGLWLPFVLLLALVLVLGVFALRDD
jgi:hypothetical protein